MCTRQGKHHGLMLLRTTITCALSPRKVILNQKNSIKLNVTCLKSLIKQFFNKERHVILNIIYIFINICYIIDSFIKTVID